MVKAYTTDPDRCLRIGSLCLKSCYALTSRETYEIDLYACLLLEAGKQSSGKRLFIGLPYTSRYVFSPFALREQGKGNAVTSGRLQLRSLSLACERTGYLEVEVSAAFRQPSLYRFTGRELGHVTNRIGSLPLYTGSIRVPLLSLNTQASVALVSDSFLPFSVVNASWEGFYTTRNRQA